MTTLFGTIAVLLYIPPGLSAAATQLAERSLDLNPVNWQQVASFLTTFFGVFSSVTFVLSNRGSSRYKWAEARRLSEGLRASYFKYISHVNPFDDSNRFSRLREHMLSIRGGRGLTGGSLVKLTATERKPHSQSDIDLLLRLYVSKQVERQGNKYRLAVSEGQLNVSFTFTFGIASLVTLSVLSLISGLLSSPIFSLLAAVLPAVPAFLYAFQLLYAWDQQIPIYEDALEVLDNVRFAISSTNVENFADNRVYMKSILEQLDSVDSIIQGQSTQNIQRAQEELATKKEERQGIIEAKPMFGSPSTQRQFQCDVFMIMPFADEFSLVYKDHIKHVTTKLDLTIKRGDDFFSEHSIMDEIWAGIFNARLVIAECTGRNANVYYELGIAHTLGKPAIMITQNLEDTPFDLRHLRTIVYKNTPEGLAELEIQLKDAIERLA